MAKDRMEQNWLRVKEQIVEMWGEFDEKDLKKARGDYGKMVDLIREKTGEDATAIMQKISALV